jgi:tetratricopeptide (TPR) repeat protein
MPAPTIRIAFVPLLFFVIQFARAEPSVEQLEKIIQAKPDHITARVKLAEHRLGEGQYAAVVSLLNTYTDQLPGSGFRTLAFAYSSQNDFANEVRILKIAEAKDATNHEWQMLLGQAYIKSSQSLKSPEKIQEHVTLGVQHLRKVLKLQPKFKPAFDLLVKTFLNQPSGNNEARELIAEGISIFGERADLFRELCRIDAQDGFLVQAIDHCGKSIELSPNYPDHYVYLVQALYDQKEEVRAERKVVAAAKKFPQSEFIQWAAGKLFLNKKNFPVATRYFEAAYRIKADSVRARFGLAQALYEGGSETEALPHFIAACKMDNKTAETFFSSGSRLKHAGKAEIGQRYTSEAYKCKP